MSRVAAAVLAAALTACAARMDSLPKHSIHTLAGMPPIGVVYELQAHALGAADPRLVGYYRARLEPLLPIVFESVRIGPADGPLQVKFVFDDGSPREANGRYLELAVGMLFLIPTYLRDRDNLDVQVEWRGTPLRQYHYETSVDTLLWLPLFPGMIVRPPARVREEAINDMIANFLSDLGADLRALDE